MSFPHFDVTGPNPVSVRVTSARVIDEGFILDFSVWICRACSLTVPTDQFLM